MTWLAPLSVIARAILEALFNGLWQGIAACLAAACLIRLSRRPNAATRYAGWWLALATIAALPLIELGVRFSPPFAPGRVAGAFSAFFSPSNPRRSEATRSATLLAPAATVPVSDVTMPGTVSGATNSVNTPATKSIERRVRFLPKLPVTTFHVRDRWVLTIFAVWLLCALCMLARPLWSIRHIAGIRRRALPLGAVHQARLNAWLQASGGSSRVRLCEAAGVSTPMSVGLLNPLIVIPGELAGQLSPAEFDHLLLHELAHVHRHDNWTHLIQKLVEAVLFFHPAVWWIAKKLELERESACDDWAVSTTGQARPYAASLAKLVEVSAPLREPMLATGVFRRARQISVRIERLLDRRRNANVRISRRLILAIVVVLASITAISSQTGAVLARPAAQVTERPAIAAAPTAENQNEDRIQQLEDRIQQLKEQLRQAENMVRKAQKMTPRADKQVRAAEKYLEQLQAQTPQIEAQLQALSEQSPEILTPQADLEIEKQVQAFNQAQNDLNALLNRNQALLGPQLNQAEQRLRELMQRDQMRNLSENMAELHHLADAKKLAQSALLAQTEKFDRSNTEFNYQQSNGMWTGLNVRTKGQIEFAEDDSDVKSVSPGGSLTIEERKGWTTRKYEVTTAGRRYWVNGAPKPLDHEARAWIAEVLPQIIRESAVGADARVKRILKQHGPNGVLDETGKIASDHAKRIYFAELFANGPLPADALHRAARQIGRDIASDGEKGRLLIDIAPAFFRDSAARTEFFDAVNTMASDGEHRRVLFAALEKDGASKDTLVLVLKSAARIASDGEKGRVLALAADAPAFNDSVSADFLHAVNTMASDGEHGRVLMALMRGDKLGRDTLVMVLKSAGRIASDGEKGRVLIRASELYTNDAAVRSAFFDATATMASDGEHAHVLTALLGKSGLDKETFIEIARSAARMASDGEKGQVLRQVAVMCPSDDAIIDALLQAVSTIASDGEYRRVMSAMTSRGDVIGKIGKIKHI